ncbi:MAG: helix-turn-helix domain-containing protein [Actinomycetota bacterium]
MSRLVYTVQEAAEELRIGNSTVRERIRSGQLRSFKDGGRRLVAGEDLMEYVRVLRDQAEDG